MNNDDPALGGPAGPVPVPPPRGPGGLAAFGRGLAGAAVGAVAGYHAFFWVLHHYGYAPVLPGALVGLGCSLLSRRRSLPLGVVCALSALGLSLFLEWKVDTRFDGRSLAYAFTHFLDLDRVSLTLIGLGAVVGGLLGMRL